MMLVLLPFLTLILILIILHQRLKCPDIRLTVLLAAVLWGVLVAVITEVLSLLHFFNRGGLAAGWGLVLLGTSVWLLLRWHRVKLKNPFAGFRPLGWFHLAGIAGIALITGAIAIIAAPNNWDSMVYHLSRAMHWLQNGSVDFYPSHILRQLYLPPWSEYLLAHLLALSGNDYFVQLPQWFAMLGSLLGVSYIAKQLGARPAGQVLTAFAAATLPMSILQSNTTQNDYILTFWLICLAAFILHNLKTPASNWNLSIGAALGLALLTKSTGYIFALPFMVYYGIMGLKHQGLRFWRPVLIISLIVLALNLTHFSRNMRLFGHPLGPQEEVARYHNDPISLKGTLSNILRNAGLYMGIVEPVNQVLDSGFAAVHNWMGIELNDARYTWSDHRFSVEPPRAHEDTTASSLHLLLVSCAFVFLVFKRQRLPSKEFIPYALLLLAGFLLFCIYLRWQTWHPRLHLPMLVLSTAWVGLLIESLDKRLLGFVRVVLTVVLAIMVLPVFYFNPNKPLIADYNIFNLPRREVMIMRKNLVVPYIESVNTLVDQDCYQVGLYLPDEAWEYPFWRLYADTGTLFRLEHVNVTNASGVLPTQAFTPCAVIATQSTGEGFIWNGEEYTLTWSMEPVYVYTK